MLLYTLKVWRLVRLGTGGKGAENTGELLTIHPASTAWSDCLPIADVNLLLATTVKTRYTASDVALPVRKNVMVTLRPHVLNGASTCYDAE